MPSIERLTESAYPLHHGSGHDGDPAVTPFNPGSIWATQVPVFAEEILYQTSSYKGTSSDKTDLFSQWHNYKSQYRFNVLFGDGHTAFFRFPLEAYKWNYTGPKPDPSFTWW